VEAQWLGAVRKGGLALGNRNISPNHMPQLTADRYRENQEAHRVESVLAERLGCAAAIDQFLKIAFEVRPLDLARSKDKIP
jgi:hypothetical protein